MRCDQDNSCTNDMIQNVHKCPDVCVFCCTTNLCTPDADYPAHKSECPKFICY